MPLQSINPATEDTLAVFDELTPAQVDAAIAAAHETSQSWARTNFDTRGKLMRQAGAYLRENKPRFAKLITLEMGKPITESEAEIEKCAWVCEYYAENARNFLADEPIETNAAQSYAAFEPLGVVLAIMPWNFPFWQVFRFAAPALMAGNTGLLKHASNVPQCALAIEEVFRESGFPSGAFRSLLLMGSAADSVIEDPRVRAVSLTGSDITGSHVASLAGQNLKKTVLELGGSDPFIVLADADLAASAVTAANARFINSGQSCIAAKRFIVVNDVADEWERLFAEEVSKLKVGDPMERDTRVGPMARGDLREALEQQVQKSLAMGARIVVGGSRLDRPGYFYAPTVMTNVTEAMPVFEQETFGPVAAVIRVNNTEEAIMTANNSVYGLGASLWTRNLDMGRELARRIEAGSVFINGMVASDPRLPFGGIKRSGYGRELSEFGIREFVNIKTVWVGPAHGATGAPSNVE